MKIIIGTIIFPIFCLFLSFFVLISDPAYSYLLLENPESVQPTKQLLKYFAGTGNVPDVFDAEEKMHLADVKKTIQYSFFLLIVLTIALCYCLTGNRRKIVRNGLILLLAILIIAMIIPFDRLFTTFHQIVFPQGNWMFSADSTLITFYPASFFVHYAVAIAIHSMIAAFSFVFSRLSHEGD